MSKARDYIPALRYGHKIMPEDLAGVLGLPYVGKVIYVDPSGGNDTANSGNSFNDAYKTVATAYAAATSGQHDVVLIAPSGGTGRTAETTAITWGKRFTHLIGAAAPTFQDARAGMNFSGTTGTASGSLTVSENGCIFRNLTLTTTDDNNSFVTVSGDYNAFIGCDFKGALNGTTGDDTAARALVLSGGQENTFAGCTFGADTFDRSAANYTVEFAAAASRNVFDDCQFIMSSDATTPRHIYFSGANSIDRWVRFNNCLWYNFTTNDTAQITAAMNLATQTATGHVLLTGHQLLVGIDNWESTASGRLWITQHTATANAVGQAINPTVD